MPVDPELAALLQRTADAAQAFGDSLNNDLNTAEALAAEIESLEPRMPLIP